MEYRLIRMDYIKEYFDLDKGDWSLVFPSQKFFILYNLFNFPNTLMKTIENDVYPNNPKMDIQYFSHLSNKIFDWCKGKRIRFFEDLEFFDYCDLKKINSDDFLRTGNRFTKSITENGSIRDKEISKYRSIEKMMINRVKENWIQFIYDEQTVANCL